MAVIDRAAMLTATKGYLPETNVLTDTEISQVIDYVIDNVIPTDDDIYEGQAQCEVLRRCAIWNKQKYSVDVSGKKREKAGQVEVEFFDGTNRRVWDDYLDGLNDFCPLILGYTIPTNSAAIIVNPGDFLIDTVNPCCNKCFSSPCCCGSSQSLIYPEQDCTNNCPNNDGF